MTIVAPFFVVFAWATGKAGNGKWDGNRKGDRTGIKQRQDNLWLVEILFTNVARDDSRLTVVLFTN